MMPHFKIGLHTVGRRCRRISKPVCTRLAVVAAAFQKSGFCLRFVALSRRLSFASLSTAVAIGRE
jgi:hypothetical protein